MFFPTKNYVCPGAPAGCFPQKVLIEQDLKIFKDRPKLFFYREYLLFQRPREY